MGLTKADTSVCSEESNVSGVLTRRRNGGYSSPDWQPQTATCRRVCDDKGPPVHCDVNPNANSSPFRDKARSIDLRC